MTQKDTHLSAAGGIVNIDNIQSKIFTIRGKQVMIDRDLAQLYDVSTKRLNEQVKRNLARFPEEFMFRLSIIEKAEVVANCDHLKSLKFSPHLPTAFTEQGVAMLSALLKSDIAIEISVQIIKAFVQMRNFLIENSNIFNRLNNIEYKQVHYQIKSDKKFKKLFNALDDKTLQPKQGIFYDGQIFDAYIFIQKLIKAANKSIILIDNYIDEDTLQIFSNRKKGTTCKIYTSKITNKLKLDLKKYNQQHENIIIHQFTKSHDRFLIIDNKDVYHIGASLKDLGKKWFAFSKLDVGSLGFMDKLGN